MTLLDILDKLDTHTCTLQLTNTTSSFKSTQKHKMRQQHDLPQILAILAFASLGTSLIPYVLALINIPKTFLYTMPSIMACLASVPFHVGAVYGFWAATRQHSYRIFRFCRTQGLTIIAYLMLLQIIWVFAAVMSGFGVRTLTRSGNEQGALCRTEYYRARASASRDACARNLTIIFTLSMSSALFEVILLGAISMLFVKWDPSDKEQHTGLDVASSHLPVALNEGKYYCDHSTYFLFPLTFISLGLALPPFIIALLDILEVPFQTIPYATTTHFGSITTLLAFVLTSYSHVALLHSSHHYHNPRSLHKPCKTVAHPNHATSTINTFSKTKINTSRLITPVVLWLLSALFNAKRLFESEDQIWPAHAYCSIMSSGDGSSTTGCIGPTYLPLSLLVSVLSASVQVVVLVAMLYIARRYFRA